MRTCWPKFYGSERPNFSQPEWCIAGKISGASRERRPCSSEACVYSSSGRRKRSLGVKDHWGLLSISSSKGSFLLCRQNHLSVRWPSTEKLENISVCVFDGTRLLYLCGKRSKNLSGTNTKQVNKVVPVYASPQSCPCCLVYLLDTYLQRLPHDASEKDVFYLRPKKAVIKPDSPWYDNVPVGREKLRTYLETMCKDAGIAERKTNQSLRATGA